MAEAIGAVGKDATTDRAARPRIVNGQAQVLLDGTEVVLAVLPEEIAGVRIAHHLHSRVQLDRKANQVGKAPPANILNALAMDLGVPGKKQFRNKSNQPPSKWTSCRKSALSQR
jgi:hypothetical protein